MNDDKDVNKYEYVVVSGSPMTGFSVVGPFKTYEDAKTYRIKMTEIHQKKDPVDSYTSFSVLTIWEPDSKGLPPQPKIKKPECRCCNCLDIEGQQPGATAG